MISKSFSSSSTITYLYRLAYQSSSNVWTELEKLQLAEAIDMYGIGNLTRIATRVPTKKLKHVEQKLRQLKIECRKEAECSDMKVMRFVNLNEMDDLFLAGGTKPKDVMVKWMEYLETFYKDPCQFDKFKLFSSAFLIMSECTPPPETTSDASNNVIDFRKVYYFLYRVFNNYYVGKNYKDTKITNYLHEMFLRVLDEIEYTSDDEKIAMYNIVSNWTSVNRDESLKVYGKSFGTETKQTELDTRLNLKTPGFKVLQHPMIPSFNPLHIQSNTPL
ncbi:uncharacterized protein LOC112603842 [Melanaphis sacchari]|uniref:uncharacterized protein LOC112603842 n=1 Tax=Melanaphis sacchari TaxID=742174 RepID=UPI000DC1454C|nr:uncharacterized protein LOC112603842 [Melanaphis sacchari]